MYSPFCEPSATAVCGARIEMLDSSSAVRPGTPLASGVGFGFATPVRTRIGTSWLRSLPTIMKPLPCGVADSVGFSWLA